MRNTRTRLVPYTVLVVLVLCLFQISEHGIVSSTELQHAQFDFTEGKVANFNFIFNYTSTIQDITFRISLTGQPPLYIVGLSSNISSLTPEEEKRFEIRLKNHLSIKRAFYEVQVTIRNISRKDAGTYVCKGFIENQKIDEYTRRCGIHVEFSPGKAICKEDPTGESRDDFIILHCSAPVGSQRGDFLCYQNGETVPQPTEPISNNTFMQKSLWVNKTVPALCCSFALGDQKTCSECNDYISNGQQDGNSTIIQNSCKIPPTVISKEYEQSLHSTPSLNEIGQNELNQITRGTEETKPKHKTSKAVIIIATLGGLFTSFILAFVIAYFIHAKRRVDVSSNMGQAQDPPTCEAELSSIREVISFHLPGSIDNI